MPENLDCDLNQLSKSATSKPPLYSPAQGQRKPKISPSGRIRKYETTKNLPQNFDQKHWSMLNLDQVPEDDNGFDNVRSAAGPKYGTNSSESMPISPSKL